LIKRAGSLLLVLGFVAAGCGHTVRETWSPVPWLQMKWTHREGFGLTFNPGVLPGLGTTSEGAFSETRLRIDRKWHTVTWSAGSQVYVLAGAHGVLVPAYGDAGPSVLWVDGRSQPAARVEGCKPLVRRNGDRVVCARCQPNEPCRRVDVVELDPLGAEVGRYGADVDPGDHWVVDGLTASGVLLRGGARSCRPAADDYSLECHNLRCQVAELLPGGLHVVARADTCQPDWFPVELGRVRAQNRAPTVR
jgi:hypothetical protein